MRRTLTVVACLGVLIFAGTSSAMAGHGPNRGPHHSRTNYGYGGYRAPWNTGYRGGGFCGPRHQVAYPVYPTYAAPIYGPAYPQAGFGVAGRNFSFWYQQ